MTRTILHIDLNNFYASVECLYNPQLRNIPLAVAGDPANRHGIILAKNMAAKKLGIKTGEAIWQAKQKAPSLVCVPPQFDKYLRFSKAARAIYSRYTNQIESFGIDECWLDVTASKNILGSGSSIAESIRKSIKGELGLTVSIGLSWNKIFAKLGSDYKKPDAITVITKNNYKKIVWSLPVTDLLYVGRSTGKKLMDRAIFTIGDLAARDPKLLELQLGKWGLILSCFARGEDTMPVKHIDERSSIKSIGNSTTTSRDLVSLQDVKLVFICLAESVAARLRENGLKCNGVEISLRSTDLSTISRQMKLSTACFNSSDILAAALQLFNNNYIFQPRKALRSVGIRGIDLVAADSGIQLSLFDPDDSDDEQKNKLAATIDMLRRRFGHNAIFRASCLCDPDLTKLNPKDDHVIHPVSFF